MGPATRDKLTALGIASVADVRARSKPALQRELGAKTGASVRPACRVLILDEAVMCCLTCLVPCRA